MIRFMKPSIKSISLAKLVSRFLGEMHCFDAGCTLPLLHAAKLTTPQLAALEFVFEPRTISAVASYLGLSRPATSQMIHKLVGRGLVKRSESTTDRRQKSALASARGRALLDKVASARAARFAASISALSPRAAGHLKSALCEAAVQMGKARTDFKRRTMQH